METIIKQKGTGCIIRGDLTPIEIIKFKAVGWIEVKDENEEID